MSLSSYFLFLAVPVYASECPRPLNPASELFGVIGVIGITY
jgi:hypothetical protein